MQKKKNLIVNQKFRYPYINKFNSTFKKFKKFSEIDDTSYRHNWILGLDNKAAKLIT